MLVLILDLIWIFLCLGGGYSYRSRATGIPGGEIGGIVGLLIVIILGLILINLMAPYFAGPAPYRAL